MPKFIPYEKLQKKKRQELDKQQRKDWGGISPVTRKPENPKAYKRKKSRTWSDDSHARDFFFQLVISNTNPQLES